MRKGNIIPKILEILQMQAEATVDLLDVFMSSYPDSRRKAWRGVTSGPEQFKTDWADKYRQRQKFYSLLNQLKNQGLVRKEKNKGSSIWAITKKGLEKLKLAKEKENFSRRSFPFEAEIDDKIKVLVFDIPEEQRQKRDWLRGAIGALGFSFLQQSVWIGKRKIPEKFIKDLRSREMLQYIHLFEVTKEGTIIDIKFDEDRKS